jgi:hypothetical protein
MKRKNIFTITFIALAIVTAMTITVFAGAFSSTAKGNEETTISEANIPSETTPVEEVVILDAVEVERVDSTSYDHANTLLEEAESRLETAQAVLDGLTTLGYEPDHPAVVLAHTEVDNSTSDLAYYQEKMVEWEEIHKWEVRKAEYPAATEAWLIMSKEFGWSDAVCAGIIGNLMAECGGCWTQDLDWQINTKHGMGMVQWIGGRRNQLVALYGENPTVRDQMMFMRDELYGLNGVTKQVTESQLNEIMNASSPEECAYAFASYYERCASQHRAPRKGYARTAYEYFVD